MDIVELKKYRDRLVNNHQDIKGNNSDKTEDVVLELENMIMYLTRTIIDLGYDYTRLLISFNIHFLGHNYMKKSELEKQSNTKNERNNDFVCLNMNNIIVMDGIPIDISLFNDIDHFQINNKYIDRDKFEMAMDNLGYNLSVNEYSKRVSVGVDFTKCQNFQKRL